MWKLFHSKKMKIPLVAWRVVQHEHDNGTTQNDFEFERNGFCSSKLLHVFELFSKKNFPQIIFKWWFKISKLFLFSWDEFIYLFSLNYLHLYCSHTLQFKFCTKVWIRRFSSRCCLIKKLTLHLKNIVFRKLVTSFDNKLLQKSYRVE